MTEQEREELIEKMAKAWWGFECDDPLKWENVSERLQAKVRRYCRALLAVAEPVIREECAQIARQKLQPHNIGGDLIVVGHTAETIAAAIREGGEVENQTKLN